MQITLTKYAANLRQYIRTSLPAGMDAAAVSSPALDTDFNTLALALFRLQVRQNAMYRRWCEANGVSPAAVTDWRQIPAIPTPAFKEVEFTSLAPEKRTHVFCSSGTTEQRASRHFHDAESLALYEASLLPWFRRGFLAGATTPPQLVFLTPPPEQAPHSSLVHMFATVAREFAGNQARFMGHTEPAGWTVNVSETASVLRQVADHGQPVAVLGTAFNFVHLLDQLDANGIRIPLPRGSRVLETGGYKGRSRTLPKKELHAAIGSAFGVPEDLIICEYGMCELSSQAYDFPRVIRASEVERVFQFPPWARVLLVSPETNRPVAEGETGVIRVVDLANLHSAVAIQTQDLGIRRGNGFELLGRTEQAEPRGCSLMS